MKRKEPEGNDSGTDCNSSAIGGELTEGKFVPVGVPVYAIDSKYIHKVWPTGNVQNKNPRDMDIIMEVLKVYFEQE